MTEPRKSEIVIKNIKIVHNMADGSIRSSVEGYEIPYNETTAIAYELMSKRILRKNEMTDNIR